MAKRNEQDMIGRTVIEEAVLCRFLAAGIALVRDGAGKVRLRDAPCCVVGELDGKEAARDAECEDKICAWDGTEYCAVAI